MARATRHALVASMLLLTAVAGLSRCQGGQAAPGTLFRGPISAVGQDEENTVVILPTNERTPLSSTTTAEQMPWFHGDAEPLTDVEALGQDLSDKDLIVYGTPTGNLWLAEHVDDFPFRIEPDRIEADRTYLGSRLRLFTACPNPDNAQRGVLIFGVQHADDLEWIALAKPRDPIDWQVAWDLNVLGSGTYEKTAEQWTFSRPEANDPLVSPRAALQAHLRANHTVIDLDNFGGSMAMLEGLLGDYDVILAGESHGVAIDYRLRLEFVKYLQHAVGLRYLLIEDCPAAAGLLNEYVATGDVSLLDRCFEGGERTPGWHQESYGFWEQLRAYNQTLAPDQRILSVGIDIDMRASLTAEYLQRLLPDAPPPPETAEVLQDVRDLEPEATDIAPSLGDVGIRLCQDIAQHPRAYAAHFGDRLLELELVADSVGPTHEARLARERGESPQWSRNRQMYQSFLKFHRANPTGKYFGQFGYAHTFRRGDRLAAYLDRHDDSPVRGRVLSIIYGHADRLEMGYSSRLRKYVARGPRRDDALCNSGLFDFYDESQPALFDLTGGESPFNTYSIIASDGAATDNFQLLLLTKGAGPTTPLEGWDWTWQG